MQAASQNSGPMMAVTPIVIRLSKLQQLFNSFDPSPFHDKDLDRDAEEYLVGSVNEYALHRPLKLVVQLPTEECSSANAKTLQDAIHNYFAYKVQEAQRRMRFQLREGRSALVIGLAFLIACTSLRSLVAVLVDGAFAEPLAEGLLILGWVAMWRPIQVLLYDWWPIRHTRRVYEKLATIPIEVRPE